MRKGLRLEAFSSFRFLIPLIRRHGTGAECDAIVIGKGLRRRAGYAVDRQRVSTVAKYIAT